MEQTIQPTCHPLLNELLAKGTNNKTLQKMQRRMEFATRIKQELKIQKITASQFAKDLGRSASEISKWLKGTHNFTLDAITDIETVLNIKLLCTDIKSDEIKLKPRVWGNLPIVSVKSLSTNSVIDHLTINPLNERLTVSHLRTLPLHS